MGKGGGHVCGERAHVSCGVCRRGTPQVLGPRRLARARAQVALDARMSRHQRPSHEDEHVAPGGVGRAEDVGPSGSAELAMMAGAGADLVCGVLRSLLAPPRRRNLARLLGRRHAREVLHCRGAGYDYHRVKRELQTAW